MPGNEAWSYKRQCWKSYEGNVTWNWHRYSYEKHCWNLAT